MNAPITTALYEQMSRACPVSHSYASRDLWRAFMYESPPKANAEMWLAVYHSGLVVLNRPGLWAVTFTRKNQMHEQPPVWTP